MRSLARARFAASARLLCALVNERLVDAELVGRDDDDDDACELTARLFASQKPATALLVSLRLRPQTTDGLNISLIDPDDLQRCVVVKESIDANGCVQYTRIGCPLVVFDVLVGCNQLLSDESTRTIKAELQNSVDIQDYIYNNRPPAPSLHSSPDDWEQYVIEGHPQHPMHRTRRAQSPLSISIETSFELAYLSFFLMPLDQVHHHGCYLDTIHPCILSALCIDPATLPVNHVVMPVHNVQLPMIQHHFPHLKRLPYRIPIRGQASLRTVVPLQKNFLPGYHIKLSLNVVTSGTLRTISYYSVHNTTIISKLALIVNENRDVLKILPEVASIGLNHENPNLSRMMGCIIRSAPYQLDQYAQDPMNEKYIICQALVERDYDTDIPLVITTFKLDTHAKRCHFFVRYIDLLIEAIALPLFKYYFAFEGHGQNMLLRVKQINDNDCNKNSFNGHQLIGFAIRDFGGVRIHRHGFEHQTNILLDNVMRESNIVLEDEDEIYHKAHHTVIDNHIHRLLRCLDLYADNSGWAFVRETISKHIDPSTQLWKVWMHDIAKVKCYMRMKINDLYRDVRLSLDIPLT